jgi:pseudaminic acid cytidylyltransferase
MPPMAAEARGNLAVIPARDGSRRVPKKNVRVLSGQPALAYSIAAARDSGLFDRIVVTTDSDEVAAVAREHGAEVPFLRPVDLADDHTPVSLATLDALERVDADGTRFARVAQLMATCPLRTAEDVRRSFEQFCRNGCDVQLSVTRFAWQNPWWAMHRGRGDTLQPLFEGEVTARSQDLPELFCPTGAIWWVRAPVLKAARTFHVAGRTGWEIPWQHGLDIDTEEDWQMAEVLLQVAAR